MKEIKAYIQPFMLQKVTNALHGVHVRGMSVSEMKGFGKEKDGSFEHSSKEDCIEYTPKVKLEIVCSDDECEALVTLIRETAHTGRRGDGKIFIYTVDEAISIRTGEHGEEAI